MQMKLKVCSILDMPTKYTIEEIKEMRRNYNRETSGDDEVVTFQVAAPRIIDQLLEELEELEGTKKIIDENIQLRILIVEMADKIDLLTKK